MQTSEKFYTVCSDFTTDEKEEKFHFNSTFKDVTAQMRTVKVSSTFLYKRFNKMWRRIITTSCIVILTSDYRTCR